MTRGGIRIVIIIINMFIITFPQSVIVCMICSHLFRYSDFLYFGLSFPQLGYQYEGYYYYYHHQMLAHVFTLERGYNLCESNWRAIHPLTHSSKPCLGNRLTTVPRSDVCSTSNREG